MRAAHSVRQPVLITVHNAFSVVVVVVAAAAAFVIFIVIVVVVCGVVLTYEDCRLFGCDSVQTDRFVPAFQKNQLRDMIGASDSVNPTYPFTTLHGITSQRLCHMNLKSNAQVATA